MPHKDLSGNEIDITDLGPPEAFARRRQHVYSAVDRCFGNTSLCSAQVRLIRPLLESIQHADEEYASFASKALADAACFASTICGLTAFPPRRLDSIAYEDVALLAIQVVSEYADCQSLLERLIEQHRAPGFVSTNLQVIVAAARLGTISDETLRQQMIRAAGDRDHAIAVCWLLAATSLTKGFVRELREASRDDAETWGGATAVATLVVWGLDEWFFDNWERGHLSRLWEEAAMWVGAMNAVSVLPLHRKVRMIERLLEMRIVEPENPLELARELLMAHFAPTTWWNVTFRDRKQLYALSPHPHVSVPRPLNEGQRRSLEILAGCPLVFGHATNLWHVFGLPETSTALLAFSESNG